jgi:ring-1,2-phenylacetyl-CoA epoxidase subunit PaaC
MNSTEATKDLLYRMADDSLIIAHRNSEWTGIGPILEEDIAFSSIAQDKMGHAQALYEILHGMGEAEPDTLAFTRDAAHFRCCHLVEYPIGDYSFSLIRNFLFNTADQLRYEMLESSTLLPLAKLSMKIRGEIKYHLFHSNTWMVQLGAKGNVESHDRMQSTLETVYPLAFSIFEPSDFEDELIRDGIFAGEHSLREKWIAAVGKVLAEANLVPPALDTIEPAYGGRKGHHTLYLQPMLEEMGEVFRIDPSAEW